MNEAAPIDPQTATPMPAEAVPPPAPIPAAARAKIGVLLVNLGTPDAAEAKAVRRYLNGKGVALNRMSTISYGKGEPVDSNKTKDGRAKNRRVVVVVLA